MADPALMDRAELMNSLTLARTELMAFDGNRLRLGEVEETLRAISHGEVDALVVSDSDPGGQVFTLSSADRPYRIFVESMREGAATLSADGVVLFINKRLEELLGCPAGDIVARPMAEFITENSRVNFFEAVGATLELELQRPDGGVVAVLGGISHLDIDDERLLCLTFTDLTSEYRLINEVRASQQRFEALYKGAPVPAHTWQVTPAGLVLIDYNDAAAQLTGGTVADALGVVATDYYRDDKQILLDLATCLTEQVIIERSTVSSRTTGDEKHFQVTMVPVPPDLVVVHTQDVTNRWAAERDLRTSEERYRSIVENAHEGISILDGKGRFTFANKGAADLLGRDVSMLKGMEASLFLGSSFNWTPTDPEKPETAQYEVTTIRPDGSSVNLLISTAPILLSSSREAGSLCMMSDLSVLRQAEEKLAHLALHDALTGLPNRILLMDRIDHALAYRSRQKGMVVVLFCDLDGFKEVNDSFGHYVGDEVLKVVSLRLRAAVRPTDTLARIGGDEFVALCQGVIDESAAFAIASRILAAVTQPLEVAGQEITLSVSVGVAFAFSTDTGDAGELLRNADAAMYLAKQRGRNRAELFDEQLRQVATERLSLISDLRHATERGELRLHYQPVFSLDGEQLRGVEALVRWQHPEHGLLFPDSFIPAAETANLIGEIGSWVLSEACRQAAMWTHAGPNGAPLHMAVNVSARQLAQGSGLVQLVADALADARIDPATLVLEVTESVLMDDAEAALAILTELKGHVGVQLAIDDFGTGYSSLVYLKRFPVDELKVDRSFVSGLGTNPDDAAIVASVVSLARAVGLVAIAEGVETAEQLAALQELGCALGQGYLWSRPVSATELNLVIDSGGFSTHGNTITLPRA